MLMLHQSGVVASKKVSIFSAASFMVSVPLLLRSKRCLRLIAEYRCPIVRTSPRTDIDISLDGIILSHLRWKQPSPSILKISKETGREQHSKRAKNDEYPVNEAHGILTRMPVQSPHLPPSLAMKKYPLTC